MYESPIKVVLSDIISDVVKKENEYIVECVQKVGVNVDKDELVKALEFDRGQYEKGWHDRDAEIVRCKDCKWRGKHGCYRNRDSYTWYNRPKDDDFCSWGERREDETD